jgi:hypothetical protein
MMSSTTASNGPCQHFGSQASYHSEPSPLEACLEGLADEPAVSVVFHHQNTHGTLVLPTCLPIAISPRAAGRVCWVS